MRFSHSARFDTFVAPAAIWNVSTRTVVFDFGGCRLAWIWQDFVGCTPRIFFISFTASTIFGSLIILSIGMIDSVLVSVAVSKKILYLLLIHPFQPVVSREDHLCCSCWRSYARAVTD